MSERVCWSCHRPHTGSVWCPHCSAPVDPESREALASPIWRTDVRALIGAEFRIPVCIVTGLRVRYDRALAGWEHIGDALVTNAHGDVHEQGGGGLCNHRVEPVRAVVFPAQA